MEVDANLGLTLSELQDYLRVKVTQSNIALARKTHLVSILEKGTPENLAEVLAALRQQVGLNNWKCSRCNFMNDAGVAVCEMCSAPLAAKAILRPRAMPTHWCCTACTDMNDSAATECRSCHAPAPVELPVPSSPLPLICATPVVAESPSIWAEVPYERSATRDFGAWPKNESEGGVHFRVWAPNAACVYVAGEFNGWSQEHALEREPDGCWQGFVEKAAAGQHYKYLIRTKDGQMLWRNDPCGRMMDLGPARNDVICKRVLFPSSAFDCPTLRHMVIYEMSVLTFSPEKTFQGAIKRLPYLASLGVNAICMMPPTQDTHAECWGYDPISLFALHRQFGTPDDLRELVLSCHKMGIACIMDWVPNHMAADSILNDFDMPGGHLYFYPDARRDTPFGTRLDFRKPQVSDYIVRSARMWLEEYGFDGLRVDSTGTLRSVNAHEPWSGKDLIEAWELMQALNDMAHSLTPPRFTIAEDLMHNSRINDTAGFDSQWDANFFTQIFRICVTLEDCNRDMDLLASVVSSTFTGICTDRVIYTESHDTVASTCSHRFPEAIEEGAEYFTAGSPAVKRSIIAATILMTSPGTPMILMGQENLERRSAVWPYPPEVDYLIDDPLRQAVYAKYAALIRLRRNLDGAASGLCGTGICLSHINNGDKVIGYHRYSHYGPGDDVLVIANFANRDLIDYRLGLTRDGRWRIRFHSDLDKTPDDSLQWIIMATRIQRDGLPFSLVISLPPYSAIILSRELPGRELPGRVNSLSIDDRP